MLGIEIEYFRQKNDSFPGWVSVEFSIAERDKPSSTFVSNVEIRKAIGTEFKKGELRLGRKMGTTHLKITPGGMLAVERYYPFGRGRSADHAMFPAFRGKGIAQILEYYVLKKAKEEYPVITHVKPQSHDAPDRRKQLQRRGFGNGALSRVYTYEEALETLRTRIALDTIRKRPVTLPKTTAASHVFRRRRKAIAFTLFRKLKKFAK